MSINWRGIDYMTRAHPLFRMAGNASLNVRRRAYEWLRDRIGGFRGKVVLDHGATPDTVSVDSNCHIPWLLADGATVYSTSPEDVSHLAERFPGLRMLAWPPRAHFDGMADLVISSSVVAHVGDAQAQQAYVDDLLSLGTSVFLTTPNRRHWLEFHTKLPLLHWLPKPAHRAVIARLGMPFWSKERNLNLLRRADVDALITKAAENARVSISREWFAPRFLGQVSNLVVLVRRTP